MSDCSDHPDHEAVARLFDLSACGETENSEFSRLNDEIYGSMFESYGAPDDAGEDSHDGRN